MTFLNCIFVNHGIVHSHVLVYFVGTVGVPKQLVIENDPSSIPDAIRKAGLSLPLGMLLFSSNGLYRSRKLGFVDMYFGSDYVIF